MFCNIKKTTKFLISLKISSERRNIMENILKIDKIENIMETNLVLLKLLIIYLLMYKKVSLLLLWERLVQVKQHF